MQTREQAFDAIRARATAVRKTMPELCALADVSRATYWRFANGKLSREGSWIPTARKLEQELVRLEAQ